MAGHGPSGDASWLVHGHAAKPVRYLGRSDLASVFGAASVVIVIILWVYYSASILLMGAEFAKAYAGVAGGPDSASR